MVSTTDSLCGRAKMANKEGVFIFLAVSKLRYFALTRLSHHVINNWMFTGGSDEEDDRK